jgi:hypothetical protein
MYWAVLLPEHNSAILTGPITSDTNAAFDFGDTGVHHGTGPPDYTAAWATLVASIAACTSA